MLLPPIPAVSPLKRVMWGLTPHADESLLGFIARTADHNVLESTFAITGQAGQVHGNRTNSAISQAVRQNELAYILRVDHEEIARRSYVHPEGEVKRSFFGLTLRYTEVEAKLRRFSPTSLRHSPHHRAIWDCRLLPFCPESWDMLSSECHRCGAQQLWRSATGISRCDTCSADLSEASAEKVAPQSREVLGWFASLLSPSSEVRDIARSSVAASLARLSPTQLVTLAIRLLAVVDPWVKTATYNGWRQDPQRYLSALVVAVPMLRDWPMGFISHVRTVQAGKGSSWHESSVKSCDRFLKKLVKDQDPALRVVGSAVLMQINPSDQLASSAHVDLQEAADLLGRGVPSLKEWRSKNLLRATVGLRKGQLSHCFDRAEITRLAEFVRDRVSAEAFAASFGMTFHGVEQLQCMQLLTASAHPWIDATYDSPQFAGSEIAKLSAKLSAAAKPVEMIESGQPLTDCLNSIGGCLRPWGPIFSALLEGTVPFALLNEGKTIAARIIVDPASRSKFASLSFDRRAYPNFAFDLGMSMVDAAANLNLSAPKAPYLKSLQRPRKFAHKYRTIPVTIVEELAGQFVSSKELTLLTGKTSRTLEIELARCGFERLHRIGWSRTCLPSLVPI